MRADRTAYLKRYYLDHRDQYAARDKAWSRKNRHKRVQYTLKSRSKNSDKYKQAQSNWRRDHSKWLADYRNRNREAIRAKLREHYRKNKESYYVKALKRRALKSKATINLKGIKDWIRGLKAKRIFTCYYCGKSFRGSSNLHIDHIVPLKEGGEHSLKNLCASCSTCNWKKGSKRISRWITEGQLLFTL